MKKVKNTAVSRFFDDFSSHYNQSAFYDSLGLDYLNQIETDFIKESVKNKKIDKLLEIGFGAGRNLSIFKNRGINIYGVDIAEKMMNETKKSLEGEKINLRHLDAEKGLPFDDNSFDLVMCIRVLKYMKKWPYVISEISRSLKKDGHAILEVPNLFSIHLFGLPFANYFLFYIPQFNQVLIKNGLKIVKIRKGAISPFFAYKLANTPAMLKLIVGLDDFMNRFLPLGLISRNYIYLVKKI